MIFSNAGLEQPLRVTGAEGDTMWWKRPGRVGPTFWERRTGRRARHPSYTNVLLNPKLTKLGPSREEVEAVVHREAKITLVYDNGVILLHYRFGITTSWLLSVAYSPDSFPPAEAAALPPLSLGEPRDRHPLRAMMTETRSGGKPMARCLRFSLEASVPQGHRRYPIRLEHTSALCSVASHLGAWAR